MSGIFVTFLTAFEAIFGFSSSDARMQPISGNFIGFNTTPFPWRGVVKVPFVGPHATKLKSKPQKMGSKATLSWVVLEVVR